MEKLPKDESDENNKNKLSDINKLYDFIKKIDKNDNILKDLNVTVFIQYEVIKALFNEMKNLKSNVGIKEKSIKIPVVYLNY